MSERIGLLSVLSELESDGLIEEQRRPVVGLDGRHSTYELTDDGRAPAASLLDQARDGLSASRRLGDRQNVAVAGTVLGKLERDRGRLEAAIDHH